MSTNPTSTSRGRPPHGGSSESAAADRDRRRHEYVELRKRLGMSRAELAQLVGLSANTLNLYPGWTLPDTAPTDVTLARMRAELVRRARQTLIEAAMREEIETDLAEVEARWHLRQCAAEAEPWDDAA